MTGGEPAFHRSLQRQLRRLGLSPDRAPDVRSWDALLDLVSVTYAEADAERYTLERSMAVSSQEMKELHDTLSHRAHHDTLTGLPNRAALEEVLQGVLSGMAHTGREAAVLFIDLDGFKLVNDSLGHAAGDELLILTSERLRSAVRPQDVVARLGGDEFVVLCPQVEDLEVTVDIARRIGEQVERPFRIGSEHTANISASIGIALAGSAKNADDLLSNADLAMYEAKARGRARYLIFNDGMRERADNRLTTENALRRAVDNGELVLHYQPILSLLDRQVLAMEAMVRWNRPDHGLVLASGFVRVAEQSRLITAIDGWVLHEACRNAASWSDRRLSVAVNLSARDVQHDHLVRTIKSALQVSGLAPRRLTLELDEASTTAGSAAITDSLAEIQRLGVELSIDDFGTGHWSPAQLRGLTARSLKIDPAITAEIDRDTAAAAITSAVISLGHALGLRVIAEGIDRREQAELLTALGCDAGQGSLFGVPEPLPRTAVSY